MRVRTLQQVTGKRPVCQSCHEPLKPRTSFFEMRGHYLRPPTAAEIEAEIAGKPLFEWSLREAIKYRYDPSLVYKMVHGPITGNLTTVYYWTRLYEGRGLGKDRVAPLFCNLEHALRFAVPCWNSGMRLVHKENNENL